VGDWQAIGVIGWSGKVVGDWQAIGPSSGMFWFRSMLQNWTLPVGAKCCVILQDGATHQY